MGGHDACSATCYMNGGISPGCYTDCILWVAAHLTSTKIAQSRRTRSFVELWKRRMVKRGGCLTSGCLLKVGYDSYVSSATATDFRELCSVMFFYQSTLELIFEAITVIVKAPFSNYLCTGYSRIWKGYLNGSARNRLTESFIHIDDLPQ